MEVIPDNDRGETLVLLCDLGKGGISMKISNFDC